MFFTIWKENNYHSKMTDHLIIILQNPTTTWVARMPLVKKKKQEFCYDNIISRGKEEDKKKFTPLIFDLKEKNK